MAQTNSFQRYLDAGTQFTQMTRKRAERIVNEFVKAGELRRKQAQGAVDDLVERSRKNTDQLMDLIRKEVTTQLSTLGLATKDDIARLESKLASVGAPNPAKKLPGAPVKAQAK